MGLKKVFLEGKKNIDSGILAALVAVNVCLLVLVVDTSFLLADAVVENKNIGKSIERSIETGTVPEEVLQKAGSVVESVEITDKKSAYKEAIESLESGDVFTAGAIFEGLDGYKDSQNYVSQIEKYKEANEALLEKDYDRAYELLGKCGISDAVVLQAYLDAYLKAVEFYEKGEILHAVDYMRGICGFLDSQYLYCCYSFEYAEQLVHEYKFSDAGMYFLNAVTNEDFMSIKYGPNRHDEVGNYYAGKEYNRAIQYWAHGGAESSFFYELGAQEPGAFTYRFVLNNGNVIWVNYNMDGTLIGTD